MGKDLNISLLYDIYAPLLTPKKREVFEMYYFDDLSLAEIACHTGTSRQGVRELIVRTEEELRAYDGALSLFKKEEESRQRDRRICLVAEKIEKEFPEEAGVLRSLVGRKGE